MARLAAMRAGGQDAKGDLLQNNCLTGGQAGFVISHPLDLSQTIKLTRTAHQGNAIERVNQQLRR